MIFLEFLVVLLNELADDGGAIGDGLWREILLGANTPNDFVIGQQHALENPMFAHEVLVG